MQKNGWKLIDSGVKSAFLHMEKDRELLASLEETKQPILHFYDFSHRSATYGYFVDPEKYLNLETADKYQLELAKRPTGGGIVFHERDLAFSILIPESHPNFSLNTLDNYLYVNEIVKRSILKFLGKKADLSLLPLEHQETLKEASFFCMAKPTKYDVILNGRKIGGGAERRTKFGFLHQGTIALSLPSDQFLKEILRSQSILECMKKNSCLVLEEHVTEEEFLIARKEIKDLLIEGFFSS